MPYDSDTERAQDGVRLALGLSEDLHELDDIAKGVEGNVDAKGFLRRVLLVQDRENSDLLALLINRAKEA